MDTLAISISRVTISRFRYTEGYHYEFNGFYGILCLFGLERAHVLNEAGDDCCFTSEQGDCASDGVWRGFPQLSSCIDADKHKQERCLLMPGERAGFGNRLQKHTRPAAFRKTKSTSVWQDAIVVVKSRVEVLATTPLQPVVR